MSVSGSILGTRVVRTEDPKLLTRGGDWIGNLRFDGGLHVTYVRSTVPHARLVRVDVDAARKAPGVVAVFAATDLDVPAAPPPMPMFNAEMGRQLLADGVVRFVGEPVVAILSEQKSQGVDAADLVEIDYEPLPPVLSVADSMKNDVLLFPAAGSNTAWAMPAPADPAIFDGCEVVVEVEVVNQRMHPAPLEVRSTAARVEPDGRLTYWACGQGAHGSLGGVVKRFDLDPASVRVITPDVGGGFGAKNGNYHEELFVAWAARKTGRPVMWTETRSESMVGMGHCRGQVQRLKLGGSRDGSIKALRFEIDQDCGAYPEIGGLLPMMTRMMASGVYAIPAVECGFTAQLTNTTPFTAFRGAGRPEATAGIERVVDVFADEIGMDPTEVRRRNFIRPDQFPYKCLPAGTTYDSGEYAAALDKTLAAAGYAELRAEQARRRAAGDRKLLGIGVSSYVEITNPMGGGDFGSIEVLPTGRAIVRTGSSPHGQGHYTVWAMLASDRTGIPVDMIEVRHGDTDDVPRGGGTGGSKSLQTAGTAVVQAADKVVELARQRAADMLEASFDDVVLDKGNAQFHVAGSPARGLSWSQVATEPLAAEADFKPDGASFPFGSHVSVVEVDADTGHVTVLRHVSCDDAGPIMNPLIFDGQVHGGVASGIAQALMEEIRFDDSGNPITANLADYGFISAAELPSFERISQETPSPLIPIGSKGIGEAGTIGATPALHNAVIDAVSHLGVRHIDMPLTAEKVWRAMQGAKA